MLNNYLKKLREKIRPIIINIKKIIVPTPTPKLKSTPPKPLTEQQKLGRVALVFVVLWYASTHFLFLLNSQQIAVSYVLTPGIKPIITASEISFNISKYQKYDIDKNYVYSLNHSDNRCSIKWSFKHQRALSPIIALNFGDKTSSKETLLIKRFLDIAIEQSQKLSGQYPRYFHLKVYGEQNIILAIHDLKCLVNQQKTSNDEAVVPKSLKTEKELNELISHMSNQNLETQQKLIVLKQEQLETPQREKFKIDVETAKKLELAYNIDSNFAAWHQQLKLFEDSSPEIRAKLPMIQPYQGR